MSNKNKISMLLLSMISATAFFSCENKEPITCILAPSSASSNSPVIIGGTIQLSTPNSGENYTYEWTGPNGFTSNQQNPVITNVTQEMAGTYKVQSVDGICKTPQSSVTVETMVNPITCTQANNTANFQLSGANVYTFNSVYTSTNTDYFELRAGGSQCDMTLTFGSDQTPLAGVYNICHNCSDSDLGNNQVNISAVALGGNYFVASSGQVVVTFVNGNISAAFCDVPFGAASSSFNPIVSAKITD